jgi:acetylornithine deacetylase
MLDKDIAAAIIAAVDAGFEAQIRFTQDMVCCPSVRGQEHTVQDLMADAMARRGLSVDHWKVKVDDIKDLPGFAPVVDATYENAYNVVGTYRPAHRHGRSLIFNGISMLCLQGTGIAGRRRPSSRASTESGCTVAAPAI